MLPSSLSNVLNLVCSQYREDALKLVNAHRSRNRKTTLTLDTTVAFNVYFYFSHFSDTQDFIQVFLCS